MRLPPFTNKIINLGINSEVPLSETRRIAIVNTLSMLIVGVGVLGSTILVPLDPTYNVFWVGLSVSALAIFPLFCNYKQKYLLAKNSFVAIFILMYSIIGYCYGRGGHAEYAIIFIPAFSFILFERNNRFLLFGLSVFSLIGMQFIYANFSPILILPDNIFFLSFTGIVFMICFFFVMDYFREETLIAEQSLEEKNKALENANAKLNLANEQLYQFTSIASHDMREPLRTISNFSKVLRRKTPVNDSSVEYLNFIEDSALRLNQMIEDLIEYARIGVDDKEVQEVDLNVVVHSVEQNLYQLIKDNDAKIVLKNKLPKAMGHNTLWIQLLQNIINNGIKYHRDGVSPRITIESECSNQQQWLLKITDNGIGIDATYFTKIFEPFRRLHSHSEFSGSGIGLATCKKIVEQYHGQINVASSPGNGTTFIIELPKNCLIAA